MYKEPATYSNLRAASRFSLGQSDAKIVSDGRTIPI